MATKTTRILTALCMATAVMSFSNVVNAAENSAKKSSEKQPGTHTQVNKIRSKLNQSKQQILEMELATQIKSCDVALAKLNSMKQQQQ